MPSTSLNLVFQYFFAVGSGIGLGLAVTIGGSYLLYNKFKGAKLWRKQARR